MASPTFLSFGSTPQRTDTVNTLLKRIAGGVENAGGGSGIGGGGLVGVVDPEGVVTADAGTPYYNRIDATFWFKSTGAGNTGWVQLV